MAAAFPAWRSWRKATSASTPGPRRALRPLTCSCAAMPSPGRRWKSSSAPSSRAASWSASTSAASSRNYTRAKKKKVGASLRPFFLLLHPASDFGPGRDDLLLVLEAALEDAAFQERLQVALDAQILEHRIRHPGHRLHIGGLIADMLDGIDRSVIG